MYRYKLLLTNLLPKWLKSWVVTEAKRAKITFNLDKRGF